MNDMIKLTIETKDKFISDEISYAYNLSIQTISSARELVIELSSLLPNYKVGRGVSHIWISNQSNERQAIINY